LRNDVVRQAIGFTIGFSIFCGLLFLALEILTRFQFPHYRELTRNGSEFEHHISNWLGDTYKSGGLASNLNGKAVVIDLGSHQLSAWNKFVPSQYLARHPEEVDIVILYKEEDAYQATGRRYATGLGETVHVKRYTYRVLDIRQQQELHVMHELNVPPPSIKIPRFFGINVQ